MSEFIGSRISLVSRSDIRYVGTLHEINSETSTVALENVSSFGTEGRKGKPEDEIAPSDNVYEYIVFRGSDVKDLRIEEVPAVKENKPPQVPDDPAILGTGSRPQAQAQPPAQAPAHQLPLHQDQQHQGVQNQGPQGQSAVSQGPQGPPGGPPGPNQFPQHPQYPPPFYPPPPGQWGRGGPPGPGYPGIPYGAPPGWYPAPGQQPYGPYAYGAFPPGPHGPPGPPGFSNQATGQQQRPAPIGPGGNKPQTPPASTGAPSAAVEKSAEGKAASKSSDPTPAARSGKFPAAAEAAKPVIKETAPPVSVSFANVAAQKSAPPTGPKASGSRIIPAVPLQGQGTTKTPLEASPGNSQNSVVGPSASTIRNSAAVDDATKVATAAVAAAMAKLPPLGGQQTNGGSAIDNLTQKVNELKTNDTIRAPRHPVPGGGFRGERVERGRGRGGRGGHEYRKIEVPATDFDFESSNAKFNKEELVKKAGSPLGETAQNGINEDLNGESTVPVVASYNKKSSFFDDLSSDNKDRAEGGRAGGREWRGEEQKKNLETFGQGSVDNGGYRGGHRGRGRGRGGLRGRGFGGNGSLAVRGGLRGGYRGGRGDLSSVSQ